MQSKLTKLNSCVWNSHKDLGKSCQCVGERLGAGGDGRMALRTKKVGVGARKVTQRGGVGAMGARRLRGSRARASSERLRTLREPTLASSS